MYLYLYYMTKAAVGTPDPQSLRVTPPWSAWAQNHDLKLHNQHPNSVGWRLAWVKSSPIHLPTQTARSLDHILMSVLLNSSILPKSCKKNVAKYNAKAPYSPSTLIMREGTGIASSARTSALCLAKTPPGTYHVESLEDDNFWMNHPKEMVATHLRTPLLKLLGNEYQQSTHTIYCQHNFRWVVSQKAWPTRGLWLAVGTFCMLKSIEEAVMFGIAPRSSKGICNCVSEKLLFHRPIWYHHVLAIVTWWSLTTID